MVRKSSLRSTLVSLFMGVALYAPQALAADVKAKPAIILVHGAFADAAGWQHVIPLLEQQGYEVTAVENALTSLPDDIATTQRVIDAHKGPVVIVGHSYGGAVITGAAVGKANVKALVYVAAFAPDANEPVAAYLEKYPALLGKALRPDAAGFLYIDRGMFKDVFAKDVDATEERVMAATQKPINSKIFPATLSAAAWKTIPSWYVVSQEDNAINPELERFYAKRMGARTSELKSSHVSFISHPREIVAVIVKAATESASMGEGKGGSGK